MLIVDDSPKAGEELRAIYEGLGLQVIGVLERALEVEAFYEEHRPDLISLDIIMPEMDGIECYFKLKEKHDEIRVIFVSALAGEARVVHSFGEQIDPACFIPKKPDPGERIREVLAWMFEGTLLPEPDGPDAPPDIPGPSAD